MGADYYEVRASLLFTFGINLVLCISCRSGGYFDACIWSLLFRVLSKPDHVVNTFIQTDADRRLLASKGSVPIGIGKNSHIKRAIIDKNARIGDNAKVISWWIAYLFWEWACGVLINYGYVHWNILLNTVDKVGPSRLSNHLSCLISGSSST